MVKVQTRSTRHETKQKGFFLSKFYNTYHIYDDYAVIEAKNAKGTNVLMAKIDVEDVDRCKKYIWRPEKIGYIYATIDGELVRLHRFILDYDGPLVIDHINRDRADNRKKNLRIVTHAENLQNQKGRSNSSEKYIYMHNGKYQVRVMENKKFVTVGSYETIEEAIEARNDYLINTQGATLIFL